jgi:hypothetical protein
VAAVKECQAIYYFAIPHNFRIAISPSPSNEGSQM